MNSLPKKMKDSEIVQTLADFASSGKYIVTPKEARSIDALYREVADLINRLKHKEALMRLDEDNMQFQLDLQQAQAANEADQEDMDEQS